MRTPGNRHPGQILVMVLCVAALSATAASPRLVSAAREQTRHRVFYDGSYRLAYPMGDVPADRGVCADVIRTLQVFLDRSGVRPTLIIHHIGAGPVEGDILFFNPITGHFRYRTQ